MIKEVLARRGFLRLAAGLLTLPLASAAESRMQIEQAEAIGCAVNNPGWKIWYKKKHSREKLYAYRLGGCDPDIMILQSHSLWFKRQRQIKRDNKAETFFEKLREQLGLDDD